MKMFFYIVILLGITNLYGQVYQYDGHLKKIRGCNHRVEILLDQPQFKESKFLSLKVMHDTNYFVRTTIINYDKEDTLGMPYVIGTKNDSIGFLYFKVYKAYDGQYKNITKRNKREDYDKNLGQSDFVVYPEREFTLDFNLVGLFGISPKKGRYKIACFYKKNCNDKLIIAKSNDLYFDVVD